jgi:hypothetical protein
MSSWIPDIDQILSSIPLFIEEYGWYIVFTAIAYYFSLPYLDNWARERSLASANDPERRRILDAERNRVRARQAIAAAKASKEN